MPTHRLSKEEVHERRARVVEMRRARRTWDEIGAALDVTAQRAHAIYKQALTERPFAQVDEHRAEEMELLDLGTRRLMAIAVATATTSPRTAVEAWNAIRGYSDSRRKLLGLDAPQQINVNHQADSDFDRAYNELLTVMRERGDASPVPTE